MNETGKELAMSVSLLESLVREILEMVSRSELKQKRTSRPAKVKTDEVAEVVKKRGRPAKVKTDEVTEVVKKRGRPAKVDEKCGKGRKECPTCHKFVGARVHVCPDCNYCFSISIKQSKIAKVEVVEVAKKRGRPAKIADEVVEVAKKRGRPAKIADEVVEVAKKRGRPAKIADELVEDDSNGGKGRRSKGESLADKLIEVLQDAANDGRRKEPGLELPEILEKLIEKDYHSAAKEKNFRVAVQSRLGNLIKEGSIAKSEDRKYSIKDAA